MLIKTIKREISTKEYSKSFNVKKLGLEKPKDR